MNLPVVRAGSVPLVMAQSSPVGLHRVLRPSGDQITLPQAADRLDASPQIWADEVRIDIEILNLDAASYRQLSGAHRLPGGGTDGAALKSAVLDIVATRGKMQNPVTGSGGMLIGTVAEVGPASPLGLAVGDHVATLVSLSLTPLQITDDLARWDGLGERVPAQGHAILFGRSIVAVLPDDMDPELALMVMDVCGAPALVARLVREYGAMGTPPSVLVLGGAGKSGSMSLAAAQDGGSGRRIAVVPNEREARMLEGTGLADHVVIADATRRWGSPLRSRLPAAQRTSPSSASTSRGASSRRCCRPHRAAPWSSSRWRPTLLRLRWGLRVWPPMCGCWSATDTCRATRTMP